MSINFLKSCTIVWLLLQPVSAGGRSSSLSSYGALGKRGSTASAFSGVSGGEGRSERNEYNETFAHLNVCV